MASIVNKVKDAMHRESDTTQSSSSDYDNNPRSSNQGPHATNLGNAADPRVDSDRSRQGLGDSYTYGSTTGTGSNTDTYGDNPRSSNLGPHSSSAMNKLDPRVDSDGDRTYNTSSSTTTGGTTGYGSTTSSGRDEYGSRTDTYGDNPRSSNLGPHSSNAMNKMDPRVDSDGDRGQSTTLGGGSGYGSSTTTTTSSGRDEYGSRPDTYGDNPRSSNLGPHSSNAMNKLDPRVDSDGDRDRQRQTASGTSGYGADSTLGDRSTGAGYAGSGNAPNTSGPHNSDLLNKLDPRVDSDLDGSRTVGGNRTFN